MANNLVDQCGSKVTVWCSDGNPMENRTLLTVDTFGVVVTPYSGEHAVFVPWCMVKYIDYKVTGTEESK
jgi:hypothetical protein